MISTTLLVLATIIFVTAVFVARERFSTLLDELEESGGDFTITRHGRPVAVLVAVDEYEALIETLNVLIETLNVLSDDDTMAALAEAEADVAGAIFVANVAKGGSTVTSNDGDHKTVSSPRARPDKPSDIIEHGWNLVDSTPPVPVSSAPMEPPAPPPPTTKC